MSTPEHVQSLLEINLAVRDSVRRALGKGSGWGVCVCGAEDGGVGGKVLWEGGVVVSGRWCVRVGGGVF